MSTIEFYFDRLVCSFFFSLIGYGMFVACFLNKSPPALLTCLWMIVTTLILFRSQLPDIILYLRDHRVRLLTQPQ